MEYIVKVIGVRANEAKLFYISDSLQDWLTVDRANAAIYYNLDDVKSTIKQGIEIIKQELDMYYHYELEGIQIVEEVITENVIQTLKSFDI